MNIQELKQVLAFADLITEVDPNMNDHTLRWGQFVAFKGDAHRIMDDAQASQIEVDQALWLLLYGITEIGQKYVSGGAPVLFLGNESSSSNFH
ncbi:hypothetical protein [Paenibacillus antarcticus]|uniref:Uncharacterized protein n=1 Tax=Paenibacillus antarcticus TaxID=253703 RepID=A0A168LVZ0_9BACL|nr:hypothetical protein [Paenibacillus antarcticus]OAB43911.1 hypothetical protein PBAT_16950 [Paenibacillus antarcticus]